MLRTYRLHLSFSLALEFIVHRGALKVTITFLFFYFYFTVYASRSRPNFLLSPIVSSF